MSKTDYMKSVGAEYERSGYTVVVNPGPPDLPANLSGQGIGLIARKGKETVAVQVKARDELYDLINNPVAERVEAIPGWSFDLVVLPADPNVEVPPDGTEADDQYISQLVDEAEAGLNAGLLRSALLIAWAAAEASMREAAHRQGSEIEREAPQVVLTTLLSDGVVSAEERERVQKCLRVRNAVVHGFEPPTFAATDVQFLLDFSQRLLSLETVGTGP